MFKAEKITEGRMGTIAVLKNDKILCKIFVTFL